MSPKKDKKNKKFDSEDKLELAQIIAERSEKITKHTEAIGDAFLRVLRWLSAWFDRILFNPRHAKLVAFAVALLIYFAFNVSASTPSPVNQARQIPDVPVVVKYNSEMYEVVDFDEKVDVIVFGDYSDISMVNPQNDLKVELDLSGLAEGTHQVNYKTNITSARIRTTITPASANVTIRIKEAKRMTLSTEFVNQNKLGSQYVLGTPELETQDVTIKASKETMSQVAFVKALIDVSGQTEQFTTDAEIAAYNQQGERLTTVDVLPKTVKAKVDVTSPNKTVPIKPVFQGDIPEGKAIASLSMDNEAMTIYAQQTVLDSIEEIKVPIQASGLTKDTKLVHNISLPSGVRHGTVSKVNFDIKLGEGETKKFDDIPILFVHNVNQLKISPGTTGDQKTATTTSLEVFGTKENIEKFKPENVKVYIDMRDIEPGDNQEVKLYVEYNDPTSSLYTVKSSKETAVFSFRK